MANRPADMSDTGINALFETYIDCNGTRCVVTKEDADAHRELLKRERAARREAADRHAELCRIEGERNSANNYFAPNYEPVFGITAGLEPPELRLVVERDPDLYSDEE